MLMHRSGRLQPGWGLGRARQGLGHENWPGGGGRLDDLNITQHTTTVNVNLLQRFIIVVLNNKNPTN